MEKEKKANNPVAPVAPAPEIKKDIVEVPRETLQKLMDRLEKVEEKNAILLEAADKGKVARIESLRNGGKLVKSVNVNLINNKVILGWTKVRDDVYFDEQGRLHEEQSIRVIYDDKSEVEMDYRSFSRLKDQILGEVISENKNREGDTTLKIILPDGRELDLDVKFVN